MIYKTLEVIMKLKDFFVDNLRVKQFSTRAEMGADAARDAEPIIADIISKKGVANIIFAAAPSQNETLGALLESDKIDWSCVNAFHMDEYIGLEKGDSHTFGTYLDEHIFSKVPFKSVNYVRGYAPDTEKECERYAALLKENPIDVVFLGIGENGHIAFNDPWVADFNDEKVIKAVELDNKCRCQQVNDGCFPTLDDVPTHALTLTIPTLFAATHLFCSVPAATKAEAVKNTLYAEINEDCPASVMRRHNSAVLYLDADSGKFVK